MQGNNPNVIFFDNFIIFHGGHPKNGADSPTRPKMIFWIKK